MQHLRIHLEDVQEELISALKKTSFFISPNIVDYIRELNQKFTPDFFTSKRGNLLIPYGDYLFTDSDCVFPGVKRKEGPFKQNGRQRGKYYASNQWIGIVPTDVENAIERDKMSILDDNIFPRHLWCFLHTGKYYSGPNWKLKVNGVALNEFEVAHLDTHKDPTNSLSKAKFTSASNTMLIPKGMARPTDVPGKAQDVFLDLQKKLYTDRIPTAQLGINIFEPVDWKHKMDELDRYRRHRLKQILKEHLIS